MTFRYVRRGLIVCAVGLSACATPYQADNSSGFAGGYREEWLSPVTLHVTVPTNGFTSARRAGRLAMLRACEVALDAWRPYLISVRAGSYRRTRTVMTKPPEHVYSVPWGGGAESYSHFSPARYAHITRHVGDALVVMLTADQYRAGEANGYDVVDCVDYLRHQATPTEQRRITGQVYDRRAGRWLPPD